MSGATNEPRRVTVRDFHDRKARGERLVVDGNIPVAVTAWLLESAAAGDIAVVLEPVSVAKARRMATVLRADRPVLAITPNIDELAALVGREVPNTVPAMSRAAAELHDRGVEHVWVRRGPRGSFLSSRSADGATAVSTNPMISTDVVDVTGAGDSMTAGFVHALLEGRDAPGAAAYGQATAALTTESGSTVRPDLTSALVSGRLTQQGSP